MSVLCGFTWLKIEENACLHVIIFRLILRCKIYGVLFAGDNFFLVAILLYENMFYM